MAVEALAVIGGLGAALQLSTAALDFSKFLYHLATNAGAAAAEIERFAHQVRSFSQAVNVAQMALAKYFRDNPQSPVVIHISSRHILADIDSEAETVQNHLLDVQAKAERLKSRSVLLAIIKWSLNKSLILKLAPEMESVKTSLNLLMVTTLFEHTLQLSRSENISREDM